MSDGCDTATAGTVAATNSDRCCLTYGSESQSPPNGTSQSGLMRRDVEFSEGARRVIEATRLAVASTENGLPAADQLLFALWQDESRAAEILLAAGFDEEKLNEFRKSRAAPSERDETSAGEASLEQIIRATKRYAATTAVLSELGTEHLLAGLMQSDTACREFLEQSGIRPEAIGHRRADRPASIGPPIDTDVQIAWREARSEVEESPVVAATAEAVGNSQSTGSVLRILDAAANRGREGLRVVEDFVRFQLNDAHLSGLLKRIRHELAEALALLGGASFHRMRDVAGDVGTGIQNEREYSRSTERDVVQANCKRVQESLRSLEEYGKLIDRAAAARIEQLRYRCCTIEQAVLNTLDSRARLASCRLYLLVTPADCRRRLEATVKQALEGGVDVVQLRDKSTEDRKIHETAGQLREWTREAGALLIINDRADIAVVTDADGVHVGQEDLPVRDARRIMGPERLVGVSTHTIEQARQAVLEGADYIGVGPVFPSVTKQLSELAGIEFVREVAAEVSLPWFAIGGISPESVGDVVEAGAGRIAVSSAITQAEEIAEAARALRERL
ncbi:MAG: thiamine phosphate synthase [Planctomycetota bacterium]|nr:MAG: thiamine phosphate synthase [Planctomycetota bacterium]